MCKLDKVPNSRFALRIAMFVMLCSVAVQAVAQNAITLNYRQTPLLTVLKEIEQQTPYKFVYNNTLVNVNRQVTVRAQNENIENVLAAVLNNTDIDYRILDNQITLSPSNLVSTQNRQQAQPEARGISGTVKDKDGSPLHGASVVVVRDSRLHTVVGADGRFVIAQGVRPDDSFIVSYLGYKAQTVTVGNRATFNITLEPDTKTIDDVVVTGYQAISRERASGSFGRISSDILAERPTVDLSSSIVGTVAGLHATENSDGTFDYIIRGISTLGDQRKPLVVVDGFPAANGFTDINPNDVLDVQILKDAAAASIWGARSANGVIVVTTKKAGLAAGGNQGVNVNVNAMVRVGKKYDPAQVIAHASTEQTIDYELMAWEKGWFFSDYSDTFSALPYSLSLVTEQLFDHRDGHISESQMNAAINNLRQYNNEKQIKDYLFNNPVLQQYNITLTHKSDRSRDYASIMYENSTANVIKNKTDRVRLNYNNNLNLFRWLDLEFNTVLHYNNSQTGGPTMGDIGSLSPYEMILDEDGSYATELRRNRRQLAKIPAGTLPYDDWSYNILREVRGRDYKTENISAQFTGSLTVKLLEGLNFTNSIMYHYGKMKVENYDSQDSYYVRDMVNYNVNYDQAAGRVLAAFLPKGGILKRNGSDARNWMYRSQVDFNRTFADKHHVVVLGGFEMRNEKTEAYTLPWVLGYDPLHNTSSTPPYGYKTASLSGSTIQFKNILGSNLSSLPVTFENSFRYGLDRFVSVYGNGSYTFDERFSLSGSIRWDASNLIAEDPKYRWSPFWSVGGLWNVQNEVFMDGLRSWLDRLALRVTYGFNGNVDKTTSTLMLLSYSGSPSVTYGNMHTGSISSYGNPTLRWEKTGSFNVGIDYVLFGNKLYGSIDIYSKQSKDVIGEKLTAKVYGTGSTNVKINTAEISNKGVETEIGVRLPIANTGMRLTTSVTYAYNKNEITALNHSLPYAYSMIDGTFIKGYPVRSIWSYTYAGMIDGTPHVIGLNGEPSTMDDVQLHNRELGMGFLNYEGPGISPHTLGWRINLSGYGFSLSMFIDGQFGGVFRNPTWVYDQLGTGKNIPSSLIGEVFAGNPGLPSWPKENATQTYLWSRYVPNLNTMIESRSFIKLREVNLDYSIPESVCSFIGIESAKANFQVRNLGCLWTKNSRHYDPEWILGTMKPVTTFAFGLNINF